MITYIHGFLGSPNDWKLLSSLLSIPHAALPIEDLHTLSEPSILVGYSMGGRLALDLAVRSPHLIQKLIILSAHPGIERDEERHTRLQRDQQWAQMIDAQGLPAFLQAWYEQPLFRSFKESPAFPDIFRERLKQDPEKVKALLLKYSPGIMPSHWSAIEKFSFPTLFLFGDRDIRYQLVRDKLLKRGISTKLIPNSGHAIHLENPVACAEKIKEFL